MMKNYIKIALYKYFGTNLPNSNAPTIQRIQECQQRQERAPMSDKVLLGDIRQQSPHQEKEKM
jgi:hypothetical protein